MINKIQNFFSAFKKGNKLKFQVGLGGLILGTGTGIENITRFLRNILLTRILAPEAFGMMAIVMAVNAMYDAFTEVGIKESIIQNPHGSTRTYLNGAWWFSVIRSSALYAIAFFAAPFIAHFYKNEHLTSLIRVCFVNMLFSGALSAGAYLALKQLNYKKWTIIISGGNLCGIATAIIAALLLKNVWALAIGFCAEAFFRLILSYCLCPFLPRFVFNKQELNELFKFAKGMFGLPILTFVCMRIDTFTLGKLYSASELGLYNMASTLAQMPSLMLSNLISQILLPAFSKMQNDAQKFGSTFFKTFSLILYLNLPLLLFCFFFGKPLLTLVYGAQYSTYSLPFAFIFMSFSIRTCQIPLTTLFYAKGRPGLNRFAMAIGAMIAIACIYPASKYFGFLGASLIVLCIWTIPFCVQFYKMQDLVPIDYYQLRNIAKTLLFMTVSFIIGYFLLNKICITSNFMIQISIGVVCCLFSYCTLLASNYSYIKLNLKRIFPSN
jgi:lipopolysaccharide exporter